VQLSDKKCDCTRPIDWTAFTDLNLYRIKEALALFVLHVVSGYVC